MLVKDYCEIKNEELRNTIIPQIEAGTLSIEDANKIHYHLLWSGISKENPDFIYERRDV